MSASGEAGLRGPNEITKIWFLVGRMARATRPYIFLSSSPAGITLSPKVKHSSLSWLSLGWEGSHTSPRLLTMVRGTQFLWLAQTQLWLKKIDPKGNLGIVSTRSKISGRWVVNTGKNSIYPRSMPFNWASNLLKWQHDCQWHRNIDISSYTPYTLLSPSHYPTALTHLVLPKAS